MFLWGYNPKTGAVLGLTARLPKDECWTRQCRIKRELERVACQRVSLVCQLAATLKRASCILEATDQRWVRRHKGEFVRKPCLPIRFHSFQPHAGLVLVLIAIAVGCCCISSHRQPCWLWWWRQRGIGWERGRRCGKAASCTDHVAGLRQAQCLALSNTEHLRNTNTVHLRMTQYRSSGRG